MVDELTHGQRDGSDFVRGAACAALIAVLAALAACGASPGRVFQSTERLRPADFRSPGVEREAQPPIPAYSGERPRAPRVEIRTLSEEEARAGVGQIETDPGGFPAPGAEGTPAPAARPGDVSALGLALVDAKVGDVNGRPIIAESWLEPMAARLRAESAGKSREQWRQFATEEIQNRLIADLGNELFLSEARTSLTPEQRTGLRVFLQRFERDVVSSNYGSATLTDEYLRRTRGQTLEEAKREQERLVLIREQLRRVVWDRVQVSSRDLRNEYDRNLDRYQPPPSAVFRLIRLRADDQPSIDEVTAALMESPFDEVADFESNSSPEPAERVVKGTLAETDLFGPEGLQAAASALRPGEWAGPIPVGTSVYWVYLDRIDETFISLYDAQRELRDTITNRRREEESNRYLLRLFDRAGIRDADIATLIARLVDVAEQWYYRPGRG